MSSKFVYFALQVVDELAAHTPGKRSLAMEAYARALRAIPTIISDNAGTARTRLQCSEKGRSPLPVASCELGRLHASRPRWCSAQSPVPPAACCLHS